jgi:hypothetical protein
MQVLADEIKIDTPQKIIELKGVPLDGFFGP